MPFLQETLYKQNVVPATRFELVTSSLPTKCSTD